MSKGPRQNDADLERETSAPILHRLMGVIESRKAAQPEASYVARLLRDGRAVIGAKIAEEAAELVDAAAEPGDAGKHHVIHELADLWFHSLVMMGWRGVSLEEVERELEQRFGVSGLCEKRSRAEPNL
jgi:phosphoribosyl-ATP pyrophosphohydrolase